MASIGDNLPEFRAVQLEFAAHIRNPEVNPPPPDIETRRMKIYVDLFFNNIKNFLDSAFPIAKQVVGEEQWRMLAREFVHKHPSESPYFLKISEEFLTFLDARGLQDLPEYLLELCHYEWVELALDVAIEETPADSFDPQGPLAGKLVMTSLLRPLVYQYPVHTIGADHQPTKAPDHPTYLLVYRNLELVVRFVASSPVTHRLITLLEEDTVEQAVALIQQELEQAGRTVDFESLSSQASQTLKHLHEVGIILGPRVALSEVEQ